MSMNMRKTINDKRSRRKRNRRRNPTPSLFRSMTAAESIEARAIAYEAALAVLG